MDLGKPATADLSKRWLPGMRQLPEWNGMVFVVADSSVLHFLHFNDLEARLMRSDPIISFQRGQVGGTDGWRLSTNSFDDLLLARFPYKWALMAQPPLQRGAEIAALIRDRPEWRKSRIGQLTKRRRN